MRVDFNNNSVSCQARVHNNVLLKNAKLQANKVDLKNFNELAYKMRLVDDNRKFKLVKRIAHNIDGRQAFIELIDTKTGEVICYAGFTKDFQNSKPRRNLLNQTLKIITESLGQLYS